jgi:leucyl-tRNA synthetase
MGMVVFGMALLNGMKMSSSKGNVFLLEDAVNEFGADTVRMFLVGSAEPWQDFDWRNELVLPVKRQIERMWQIVLDSHLASGSASIDAWLISRLQNRINTVTMAFSAFQTRKALQEAYNGVISDLSWYRRRLPKNSNGTAVLHEVISVWIRLMAPIIPYTTEKLWSETGHVDLASFAPWPIADPTKVSGVVEISEELLKRTIEDILSILKLVRVKARKVTLFVAPTWKHRVFTIVVATKDKHNVMKTVMADADLRAKGEDVASVVTQTMKLIHSLPPELVVSIATGIDEFSILSAAKAFLEKESGLAIEIVAAESSSHPKGRMALPFKPAIVVE